MHTLRDTTPFNVHTDDRSHLQGWTKEVQAEQQEIICPR